MSYFYTLKFFSQLKCLVEITLCIPTYKMEPHQIITQILLTDKKHNKTIVT